MGRPGFRVLVCGSRHLGEAHRAAIWERLDALHLPRSAVVIHGAAKGADTLAWEWAEQAGTAWRPFYADWKKHGNAAGPLRNQRMLDEGKPDLVLAFHTVPTLGRGTADMVGRARRAGVPVEVTILPEAR